MSEAFISYSRGDTAFVDKLRHDLEKRGIPVWIDRESIEGGSAWRASISQAIRSCCAFILIVSPRSTHSNQVSKELSVAESHERLIVPVVLEASEIPPGMELQLAELQWISFAELSYDAALDRLTRVIEEARSRTEAPATSGLSAGTQTAASAAAATTRRVVAAKASSGSSAGANGKWLLAGTAAVVVVAASIAGLQLKQKDTTEVVRKGPRADVQPSPATPAPPPTAVPVVAPQPEARAAAAAGSAPIVGNTRTLVYHYPGCPNYASVAPQARTEFASAREAERAGYKLAVNCTDPSGGRPAAAVLANSRTKEYFLPQCRGYTATRNEYRVPFDSAAEAEKAGYRRAENCS
jgi:hypothetical protein